jgi:hypothetical protein
LSTKAEWAERLQLEAHKTVELLATLAISRAEEPLVLAPAQTRTQHSMVPLAVAAWWWSGGRPRFVYFQDRLL